MPERVLLAAGGGASYYYFERVKNGNTANKEQQILEQAQNELRKEQADDQS